MTEQRAKVLAAVSADAAVSNVAAVDQASASVRQMVASLGLVESEREAFVLGVAAAGFLASAFDERAAAAVFGLAIAANAAVMPEARP